MTAADEAELMQWCDDRGFTSAQRETVSAAADHLNDFLLSSDDDLRDIGGAWLLNAVESTRRGDSPAAPQLAPESAAQQPEAAPEPEPAAALEPEPAPPPPPPPASAVAILDAIVAAPAVDEVAALLRATRLTQYGSSFAENDIDLLAIPLLQPEHWRTLGVSLGHQVRILHAARELGEIHGVVAAPMVQAPAPAAPVPAEPAAAPPAGQASPLAPPPPAALPAPPMPPVAQELARALAQAPLLAPPPPPPPSDDDVDEPPPGNAPPTAEGSGAEDNEERGHAGQPLHPPVAQAPAWFPAPDEAPSPPQSPAAAPPSPAAPLPATAPRVNATGRRPTVGAFAAPPAAPPPPPAFAPPPLSPAAPPLAQAVAPPPAQRQHVASAASAWVKVCTDLLEAVKDRSGIMGLRGALTSSGFKCGPTVVGKTYYEITVPLESPCSYDLVGKDYHAANQDVLRSKTQLMKYLEGCLALARAGTSYRTEAERASDGGEFARRAALIESDDDVDEDAPPPSPVSKRAPAPRKAKEKPATEPASPPPPPPRAPEFGVGAAVDVAAAAFGHEFVKYARRGGPKLFRGTVVAGDAVAGSLNVHYEGDGETFLTEARYLTLASARRVTLEAFFAMDDEAPPVLDAYAVGDKVDARFHGDMRGWYRGEINAIKVDDDGRPLYYAVAFDDGDRDDRVKPCHVRALSPFDGRGAATPAEESDATPAPRAFGDDDGTEPDVDVPAPGTNFRDDGRDGGRRWVVFKREGKYMSLPVEGTQKRRRVLFDVVFYYPQGTAAPADDDYEEICEYSSLAEVAQWCAASRVLDEADEDTDDEDVADLRVLLKARSVAAGRAAFRRAQAVPPAPAPAPRKTAADAPACGTHLALSDDSSVKGVAGSVDVYGNGHVWVDLQTTKGHVHRVRSTQVVAVTLTAAEVTLCGNALSPKRWLEGRLDGELNVPVWPAGARKRASAGNSIYDGPVASAFASKAYKAEVERQPEGVDLKFICTWIVGNVLEYRSATASDAALNQGVGRVLRNRPEYFKEKRGFLWRHLAIGVEPVPARVVGNSFVDGAGVARRQFVVEAHGGGLRCALCDWKPRCCVPVGDLRTDKDAWRKLMHALKSHAGFFPSTRTDNTHFAALKRALATAAPAPAAPVPALAAPTPTLTPPAPPPAPARAPRSQNLGPCRPGAQGPKSLFVPPAGPHRAKRARTGEAAVFLFRKGESVLVQHGTDGREESLATVEVDVLAGARTVRLRWQTGRLGVDEQPVARVRALGAERQLRGR